jgi:thiaminase
MDLQVAMAPCSLGYGEIGRKLYDDPNTKRGVYS